MNLASPLSITRAWRHQQARTGPLRGAQAGRLATACAALCLLFGAQAAYAVEATWSGFATLGYARSDSDYTYQGSINREGTLLRDSLAAGQVDLTLAPQLSATLQVKVAQSPTAEHRYSAQTAWAFIAWRPSNDWLLRAGRTRLPLYLHSESLDVGVANDMARLPYELYSVSPTNDFDGLFATRTFTLGQRDINVDAYLGQADATARLWLRDGLPPVQAAGAFYKTVQVKVFGLAVGSRDTDLSWRVSLHSTRTRSADGRPLPASFPRVDLGPGIGYWKVDDSQPGPAIASIASFRNRLFSAGAEWQINRDWRIAGEYVDMRQFATELGSESKAGYVAVFRNIGAWTPYVSLARQRSSDTVLGWRLRLTQPSMPSYIPGADQLNAAQRIAGELGYAFDQRSTALGASYAISPTTKLKGEWMRTKVGAASGHFDTPAGQPDAAGLGVNTLTVNVNVAF
jgi:hypothetical protein